MKNQCLAKKTKFAVIKVERNIKFKELKTEDEKLLVGSLKNQRKVNNRISNDFESVNNIEVGGMTEEITLKVVRNLES